MDNKYIEILNKIKYLKNMVNIAYNNGPYKEMEDKIALSIIGKLLRQLDDAESILDHYSKPVKEGFLQEIKNKRFLVKYDQGGQSRPLSCGDKLEAFLKEDAEKYIDEGWNAGQVEFKNGYIFMMPGKISFLLHNGMKVRLRINE